MRLTVFIDTSILMRMVGYTTDFCIIKGNLLCKMESKQEYNDS